MYIKTFYNGTVILSQDLRLALYLADPPVCEPLLSRRRQPEESRMAPLAIAAENLCVELVKQTR
jgi:hypothetical protein